MFPVNTIRPLLIDAVAVDDGLFPNGSGFTLRGFGWSFRLRLPSLIHLVIVVFAVIVVGGGGGGGADGDRWSLLTR